MTTTISCKRGKKEVPETPKPKKFKCIHCKTFFPSTEAWKDHTCDSPQKK